MCPTCYQLMILKLVYNIIHLSLYDGWGQELARFYMKFYNVCSHMRALHYLIELKNSGDAM